MELLSSASMGWITSPLNAQLLMENQQRDMRLSDLPPQISGMEDYIPKFLPRHAPFTTGSTCTIWKSNGCDGRDFRRGGRQLCHTQIGAERLIFALVAAEIQV